MKFIQISQGLRLAYLEQGDASGTPLILLHGYSDSCQSFAPLLAHLPPALRAFAVSQRGHGESDRPRAGYRTRDFACDIARFVDCLDLGPCIVVGHSMGSANALRFAIDYPQHTLGLVLMNAFAGYRNNPVVQEVWDEGVSKLEDPVDPEFVRAFQQSTLANPVPPDFFETVVRESLKLPAWTWKAVFREFFDDDLADELHHVRAPTLILWGDQDTICPRMDQEILRREIAGSRLVTFEGVGHAVHWEVPERCAAELVAFSQSLEEPARGKCPTRPPSAARSRGASGGR